MRNQGRTTVAIILILAGMIFLLANFFDYSGWVIFWPLFLIALGLYFIFLPNLGMGARDVDLQVFGLDRFGEWQVKDEEIWMFVGDVELDFTDAIIPAGESSLRLLAFVGDLDVRIPAGVGFSMSSAAFVTDAKVNGHKKDSILVPYHYTSDGYERAERKVRLEVTCFVADISVRMA